MDFSFSEDQDSIRELARQILSTEVTVDRLKEVEAGDEHIDRRTWSKLAEAGLLGLALPEDVGGAGLGFLEVCLVLEEAGRTVAPLPLLPTLVLGALPIARFGTDEQCKALLPGVANGETLLTAG